MQLPAYVNDITETVARALAEDIGSGDVTARLVAADQQARAHIIARESAVICGRPWVEEVFRQIDPTVALKWRVAEGGRVHAGQSVLSMSGPARALLTGERTALNFLQTLSGTATAVARYVDAVAGTACRIADTRKTLPGLRNAQKYAVLCGGGVNHRIGLYDGILIKENHIAAAGGITQAIAQARALNAGVPLMTEAENLDEVRAALAADVDLLLVDDFSIDDLRAAVRLTQAHRAVGGRTLIEYSGGATLERIRELAETGVDRISVGAITKHLRAIDLSMRFY
ncbi:nicotinate-nucleotide pyrophosphorylase [carboxylating] [Fontimonas thermophila]|uniref:Probable nicotinate-nucleotide pyrophosphorylase [carboxylating] n=1 Tax=Fontimonas thermophila TaxID=1076937 RepID=A0A1I2IU74_9GAMM|nr:carboxylating nicotinate-nucleotide diphosphorylase [Fontimonas thermophila]SFF45178.1 nicotinate-nucleotide pyrophosphorylase [carboxylating] [Fontimonas thermophila]